MSSPRSRGPAGQPCPPRASCDSPEPRAQLAQQHQRPQRVLANTRGSCAAQNSLQGQSLINWNCLAFRRDDEKLWEAIEAFLLAQALGRDDIYVMELRLELQSQPFYKGLNLFVFIGPSPFPRLGFISLMEP